VLPSINPALKQAAVSDVAFDFGQHEDTESLPEWQQQPIPPSITLDYEGYNLDMLAKPTDHFILNPETAMYKNDRRVEIILLKI
jgi:hypothetical protein